MKFSILTPTYNRAKYLNRLYESIEKNEANKYNIEWLIMDDGSTDDTEQKINQIKLKNEHNNSKIEIKFFKQENQGKMAAINNLAKYVSGEIWIECDSDDYFVENIFEKIMKQYEKIKNRKDIYAISYLKKDQNGNNMGNKFKTNETTMFGLYFKQGETGEKALCFITEIRKKYKYELEHNEKFVTEARMYHKMDKNYKMICINDYMMICEYQDEGYSKNIDKQFIQNPYGYYKYFYEILNDMDMKNVLFKKRLYAIKHYILFSYLTNNKYNLKNTSFVDKLLTKLLWLPGMVKARKFEKKVT